jgi:hypothetical protein
LQSLNERQPLLEELSLIDHFVHLSFVFGVGLILSRQHFFPLSQLGRKAFLGSLNQRKL